MVKKGQRPLFTTLQPSRSFFVYDEGSYDAWHPCTKCEQEYYQDRSASFVNDGQWGEDDT